MKRISLKVKILIPILVGVFLVFGSLVGYLVYDEYNLAAREARLTAANVTEDTGDRVAREIDRALWTVSTLAEAAVSLHGSDAGLSREAMDKLLQGGRMPTRSL